VTLPHPKLEVIDQGYFVTLININQNPIFLSSPHLHGGIVIPWRKSLQIPHDWLESLQVFDTDPQRNESS
jgi:hypothetical protein